MLFKNIVISYKKHWERSLKNWDVKLMQPSKQLKESALILRTYGQ